MENTNYWMLYRGFRRYLGEWRMVRWKLAQRIWHRAHPIAIGGHHICGICLGIIWDDKDFTLDHIIPIEQVVMDQLDPELLFEKDLQAAHNRCNTKKGNRRVEVLAWGPVVQWRYECGRSPLSTAAVH